MTTLAVSENTKVTLHFALFLEDGSEIDSNFGREAATFVVGDGSLLPGFERALFGLLPGTESELLITPENAFGQPNDNNIQVVKRNDFDAEAELECGMVFAFADAAGGEVPGVVAAFDDTEVSVDFNHPLAGRNITFRVHIHKVEAAELH